MKMGAVNSVPKGGITTASYLYLFIFILSLFSKEPVDGADEIFTVTNFLLAYGVTSICSRLDDLKRK